MKPLLGQLQNQPSLDDLLGSPKSVGGNFGRSGSSKADDKSNDSSFTDMLLSTINKAHSSKPAGKPHQPEAKVPDTTPRLQRPPLKNSSDDSTTSTKSNAIADAIARDAARKDNDTLRRTAKSEGDKDAFDRSIDAARDPIKNESNTPADGQVAQVKSPIKPSPKDAKQISGQNAIGASNDLQSQGSAMENLTANVNPSVNNAVNPLLIPTQLNPQSLGLVGGINTTDPAIDPKVALSPLKNLMSGQSSSESLLNRNAILAFVTGRLEKLDPDTLPTLVSDSALIKQVLSSGDVAKFMQTPMTIGDLANLLELDQSLLNKASQAGLDPSKLVTPKDFINALGLDAGRVTSELTILQQKLPAEGLGSYIQRARALVASTEKVAANTVKGINQNPSAPKINKDGTDTINNPKTTLPASDSLAKKTNTKILPEDATNRPDLSLTNQFVGQQATNMTSMGQLQSPISALNPGGVPSNGITSVGSKPSSITQIAGAGPVDPAELLSSQGFSPLSQLSGPAMASPNSRIADHRLGSEGITNELFSLESSEISDAFSLELDSREITSDPYQQMGEIIDSSKSLKIDFGGDGISQRSLEEHLLARGIDTSLVQKQMQKSDSSDGITESPRLELNQEIKDAPIDLPRDFQLSLNQDIVTPTSLSKDISFSSGSFSDKGPSQDNSEAFFSEQIADVSGNLTKGTAEVRESADIFTNKLTDGPKPTSKESIASKILGHAQMMFKNGGGSMRVDVEAPGIGKVDVAINLINNQLDVRIITATEQARDMISKEVAGLRDGLTQQGISLRGLEVGKAGESSPRHFAGQGQQFGQGAQDQRASYNDMREYAQNFRKSYAPRIDRAAEAAPSINRWSNGAIPSLNNGRLEVRV